MGGLTLLLLLLVTTDASPISRDIPNFPLAQLDPLAKLPKMVLPMSVFAILQALYTR